ncbi:hypothetical protein HanHA300_Chr08g0286161 [Helianthus annuus]|nr:hypothetical protein HanHA300_Chr08g0286161 [Helianthus annuus]
MNLNRVDGCGGFLAIQDPCSSKWVTNSGFCSVPSQFSSKLESNLSHRTEASIKRSCRRSLQVKIVSVKANTVLGSSSRVDFSIFLRALFYKKSQTQQLIISRLHQLSSRFKCTSYVTNVSILATPFLCLPLFGV